MPPLPLNYDMPPPPPLSKFRLGDRFPGLPLHNGHTGGSPAPPTTLLTYITHPAPVPFKRPANYPFPLSPSLLAKARVALLLVALLAVGRYSLLIAVSRIDPYEPEIGQLRTINGQQQQLRHGWSSHSHSRSSIGSLPVDVLDGAATDDDYQNIDSLDEYIICDRSHHRTDVCRMKGDLRVDGKSKSILLYSKEPGNFSPVEEKIRPYTRKWEESVMNTIDEITLRKVAAEAVVAGGSNSSSPASLRQQHKCDVEHKVPAVVLSTGGYTGNVYHEFNDGIIPMFITASRFRGEVVFVISEYHGWWMSKYVEIFRQLSHYEPVDFNNDTRVHCFPEVTVGLKIHDELTIDSSIDGTVSMAAFQRMLHDAYALKPSGKNPEDIISSNNNNNNNNNGNGNGGGKKAVEEEQSKKVPTMLIISRNTGSRSIVNEGAMVRMGRELGFKVRVLKPEPTTEMRKVYMALQGCDVMVGVHGAAMTHLLFMRPDSSFVQVIPLGTDWAALNYYGQPALRLGLRYVEYHILPQESTLWDEYPPNHPVLVNPDSVNQKGWWETKRVYLDGQKINLHLPRFRTVLLESYKWATSVPSLPRGLSGNTMAAL